MCEKCIEAISDGLQEAFSLFENLTPENISSITTIFMVGWNARTKKLSHDLNYNDPHTNEKVH